MVSVEELVVLRDRYPNVMIMGSEPAIGAALGEIRGLLRQPITCVDVDSSVELPLTFTEGTLIARGVGRLNADEQQRLYAWLGRTCGATQVVVTTTVPVFSSVQRGTFVDVLYYRLNTVYLEVGGA